MKRSVDLHVDVGAETEDYAEIAKTEKLKPLEAELKQLERLIEVVAREMDELKEREAQMRDTNGNGRFIEKRNKKKIPIQCCQRDVELVLSFIFTLSIKTSFLFPFSSFNSSINFFYAHNIFSFVLF